MRSPPERAMRLDQLEDHPLPDPRGATAHATMRVPLRAWPLRVVQAVLRPVPLAAVTTELRAFFEENPAQTGRELLQRLQSAFPGRYPDALLRTVQRRIKGWRAEMARALVFGSSETMSADGVAADALRNGEAPRVSGHPVLIESID